MARMYVSVPYDYAEEMETLSDAEFGRLVRALILYSRDGATPALSGNERIVWPRVRMQEDRMKANYEDAVQAHTEAGKKGGRPKNQVKPNENQMLFDEKQKNQMLFDEKQKNQMLFDENQIKATESKKTYTKTNTETNSKKENFPLTGEVKEKSADKPRPARFEPPSEALVIAYFAQQGSTAQEASSFWDYYQSKGWKVGKAPMKDWKSAARNWIRRAAEYSPRPQKPSSPSWEQSNPFLDIIQEDMNGGNDT